MNRYLRILCLLFGALLLADGAVCQKSRTDSLVLSADRAYLESRYVRAIEILRAVSADSLPVRGLFTLGSSYAALNDHERALQFLRKAIDREPGNPSYRFSLARTLALAGMNRDAETEYRRLLAVDSLFVPAQLNLGLLSFDRREYPGAIDRFLRVIDLNPRDYLTLYYLGLCYANLDSLEQARSYLAASLTLNPRYGPGLSQLASLYYRQSDYRQALRLYRIGVREYPEQAEYWYNQGLCLEKFQDWQGARDSYREAVARDSSNSLYWAHLGQVFFEMTQFDSSAGAYRTAVRLDEENPVLLLNLGLAYARMGDVVHAEKAFQESIAAHEPAQVARVYNQLGALYYTRKRMRDARRAYQQALRYDPSNLEALFYSAVTLDQMKQYNRAKEAYTRYLRQAGKDPSQSEKVKLATDRINVLP